MKLRDLEIKCSVMKAVQDRLHDGAENITQARLRAEGGALALQKLSVQLLELHKIVDTDVDAGKISSLEEAATVKKFISRAHDMCVLTMKSAEMDACFERGREERGSTTKSILEKEIQASKDKLERLRLGISSGVLRVDEDGEIVPVEDAHPMEDKGAEVIPLTGPRPGREPGVHPGPTIKERRRREAEEEAKRASNAAAPAEAASVEAEAPPAPERRKSRSRKRKSAADARP